jgi:hypothetical protein
MDLTKKKYALIAFTVFVMIAIYLGSKNGMLVNPPPVSTSILPGYTLYKNTAHHFGVHYYSGMRIDENYTYDVYPALGPSYKLSGVAFFVPKELTTGTNLSADTHISIEFLPEGALCEATSFLGDQINSQTVAVVGNTTYTVAKGGGAGAGNLYEETVSFAPSVEPCVGIRLFTHSTNIGNYDPGTINAFDKNALEKIYEEMRGSLTKI